MSYLIAFYHMQGEGCLLLPRSSTVTLLLDLCTEAGWGVSIITQILHSYPITRPPYRSRVRGVYYYPDPPQLPYY